MKTFEDNDSCEKIFTQRTFFLYKTELNFMRSTHCLTYHINLDRTLVFLFYSLAIVQRRPMKDYGTSYGTRRKLKNHLEPSNKEMSCCSFDATLESMTNV